MANNNSQLQIPVGLSDHIRGNDKARVTLVEYGDYQCPYCGRAHPIVKEIERRMGDRLRLVFRNFPLSQLHPHAVAAAEMAEVAGLQGKFWPMHDYLFEHQSALGNSDLLAYAKHFQLDIARMNAALESGEVDKRVKADMMGGVQSGVNGTPTFFINGEKFEDNWTDLDIFIASLESAAKGSMA